MPRISRYFVNPTNPLTNLKSIDSEPFFCYNKQITWVLTNPLYQG